MLSIGVTEGAKRYANFQTALFLGTGSLLFVYIFVLWLVGFIDFWGDALVSGIVWKIPALLGFVIGVTFVALRNPGLKWPTLIIFVIATIAGVVETILLVFSLLGCIADTHPIPCSTFDIILIGILLAGSVLHVITSYLVAGALFGYQAAVRLAVIMSSSEPGREELARQEEGEDF